MDKARCVVNAFKKLMKRYEYLMVVDWKYDYIQEILSAKIYHKDNLERFMHLFKFDASPYSAPSDLVAIKPFDVYTFE